MNDNLCHLVIPVELFSLQIVPNSGPGWDNFAVQSIEQSNSYDQLYRTNTGGAQQSLLPRHLDNSTKRKLQNLDNHRQRSSNASQFMPSKTDDSRDRSNFHGRLKYLFDNMRSSESIEVYDKKSNTTYNNTNKSPSSKPGAYLITLKELDYEDFNQRKGFIFLVQVSDKVSL